MTAIVSYRTPHGWTHRPADRDAENLRLERRHRRAVALARVLATPVNARLAADREAWSTRVLASLNLTPDEWDAAQAEAAAGGAR